MKKILSCLAILSIVISCTFLFSCESTAFCCQDQHSASSDCSVCSNHVETTYTPDLAPILSKLPEIVGMITFVHIDSKIIHIVYSPDRPPIG